MPKLPTAEEVFGARQIPQARRPIQGYDTNAISQANIRSGANIENIGQNMVSFGSDITNEKERQAEKAERERERAEAKLERENLKYDAAVEARVRSDYLLKKFDLMERARTDPNFDIKAIDDEFPKLRQTYIGAFKTQEGSASFDIFDRNTVAELKYDLGGVLLQRTQSAFIADADNRIEELALRMSQSKDQKEIAEMSVAMQKLVSSKESIVGINKEVTLKQKRDIKTQTAIASVRALPKEQQEQLLFGGGDEYYDSEKPAGADYVTVVRSIESAGSGDLAAQNPNSSAKGRYQWTDATAKQYGLLGKGFDHRGDAEKEEVAFKKFTEDNRATLNSALGRMPTDAELYLAHQQGATGAANLLADPNAKAIDVVGRDAVINNGGNADMTAGEFANKWISKYEEKAGGVSNRYQGTPLAYLDGDSIQKLQAEYATTALESDPQSLIDMIDAGKMGNVTPNVRMNLKDQALARIERNKEIAEEQYLIDAIEKYKKVIDSDSSGNLTHAEVTTFKIEAGQDQEKLKVADALFAKMAKPVNIKESSDEARALYGEIMAEFGSLMKDPETKKPVEGLTDMMRWYQKATENRGLLTREDNIKIERLGQLIEARVGGVNKNGWWGNRADKLSEDPYVDAYDEVDNFFDTNKKLDTPENRFNLMSSIVPIADAMIADPSEPLDSGILVSIGKRVIRNYVESIDPQFKGMEELPDKIILKNGESITIPKSLATAKGQAKVTPNIILQDKYILTNGQTYTREDVERSAKKMGKTPEQIIAAFKSKGLL